MRELSCKKKQKKVCNTIFDENLAKNHAAIIIDGKFQFIIDFWLQGIVRYGFGLFLPILVGSFACYFV